MKQEFLFKTLVISAALLSLGLNKADAQGAGPLIEADIADDMKKDADASLDTGPAGATTNNETVKPEATKNEGSKKEDKSTATPAPTSNPTPDPMKAHKKAKDTFDGGKDEVEALPVGGPDYLPPKTEEKARAQELEEGEPKYNYWLSNDLKGWIPPPDPVKNAKRKLAEREKAQTLAESKKPTTGQIVEAIFKALVFPILFSAAGAGIGFVLSMALGWGFWGGMLASAGLGFLSYYLAQSLVSGKNGDMLRGGLTFLGGAGGFLAGGFLSSFAFWPTLLLGVGGALLTYFLSDSPAKGMNAKQEQDKLEEAKKKAQEKAEEEGEISS